MKNTFKNKSKTVFLFEYLSIGAEVDYNILSPKLKTSLSVVFDAGTQLRYSSVKFVLYCKLCSRVQIEGDCVRSTLGFI